MASVLKADGAAADAWVQKDFGSSESDVYLTMDVLIPATHEAAIVGDLGYGPNFCELDWPGFPGTGDQGLLTAPDGSDVGLEVTYDGLAPFGSPVSADAWHTVEMRVQSGSPITTDVWIDGVSQTFAATSHNQTPYSAARFGLIYSNPDARQVYYLDNIKIGTTRGGTEIFSEDFEGATPLANFDSTSGDVSIVADPSTPGNPDPVGVCIAFEDETLEPAPLWTRLDDPAGYRLVTRWSISRGRQSELDKTGTGTASIELVDKDGTLDPTNPSSPFAGLLDPMKQAAIALRNPVLDTWHTVFRGFVSDWFYDLDVSGRFGTVRLELADAFDLLAALEMTPGHHGDTTPAGSEGDIYFSKTVGPTPGPFTRITKILDDAGWPDLRFVLTGNVQLQGTVYARRDQALAALFDTADAEFPGVGNVYVNRLGEIAFRGRYSRFDPENPDWGIDFFNAGGRPQADADPDNVAPVTGVSFRRSKSDIINAALCLPQNVDDTDVPGSLVKDDASIATFGWRSVSFDNLLTYSGRETSSDTTFPVNAVDETKLYAQYYVDNYAQPTTRVDKITFRSRGVENAWAGALWLILCTVDIGDVLHLTTTHPGGGGFDEDYFVEGLTYDCSPKSEEDDGDGFPDVTLELDVSPRALYGLSPFSLSSEGSDSVEIEGVPEVGETLDAV